MTTRRLAPDEARRIAIRAQRLTADRPVDLVTLVEDLTLLQLDPTSVVAPSADLVVWSRLGRRYDPGLLRDAVAVDRTVFEHRHREDPSSGNIAVLRPMSTIGWYLAEMRELRHETGQVNDWLAANAGFERRVLDQLRDEGPLPSKAITDTAEVPWKSTGWNDGRNVTQLIQFLASRGEVAVSRRDGKQRLWDLAERVYPDEIEVLPAPDAERRRNEARLRSLGVARPKFVGDAGIPVTIEGTDREWRLDPDATAEGFEGRTALLSPFDRLVHARDRSLDLFGFEFMIELYKPKAKRRWGYYALPVLHHDRLIGKVDLAADRDVSQLVVLQITEDERWGLDVTTAVEAELASLANWLGLEGVGSPVR